jgi:hypothetical protein
MSRRIATLHHRGRAISETCCGRRLICDRPTWSRASARPSCSPTRSRRLREGPTARTTRSRRARTLDRRPQMRVRRRPGLVSEDPQSPPAVPRFRQALQPSPQRRCQPIICRMAIRDEPVVHHLTDPVSLQAASLTRRSDFVPDHRPRRQWPKFTSDARGQCAHRFGRTCRQQPTRLRRLSGPDVPRG